MILMTDFRFEQVISRIPTNFHYDVMVINYTQVQNLLKDFALVEYSMTSQNTVQWCWQNIIQPKYPSMRMVPWHGTIQKGDTIVTMFGEIAVVYTVGTARSR